MIAARKISAVAGRRAFSSVEAPRLTIAKNVLICDELAGAKTSTELEAALKVSHQINTLALPTPLLGLGAYIAGTTKEAAVAGFVADKAAWQNMAVADYVQTEAVRADTWPFLVGGA
jgi:hypothetical protein